MKFPACQLLLNIPKQFLHSLILYRPINAPTGVEAVKESGAGVRRGRGKKFSGSVCEQCRS
jgi:hypothetical protein